MTYLRRLSLKRIAKAIKTLSKTTQAIALLTIIIFVLAILSSIFASSTIWVPIWASFGGLLVFLGLWIEKKEGEEKNERFSPPFFKPYKFLENYGWRILMYGIGAEIVIGFILAAIEQINETNNNPLNQRAESAKAVLFLWTEGTNDVLSTHDLNALLPTASKVAFGDPELMKKGAPSLFSPFPLIQAVLPADSTNIRWQFRFDQNGFVFSDSGVITNVFSALSWRKFEIDVPFFRPGTKILAGELNLTVNNSTTNISFSNKTVQLASSNNLQAFWDSKTNGVAIFNQTNTYSLVR